MGHSVLQDGCHGIQLECARSCYSWPVHHPL